MNRYKPRKLKSPIKAIREHCIECMGGRGTKQKYSKLIDECSAPDCGLYEFRFGVNPYHRPNLSSAQRSVRAERAKNSSLIRRATGKTSQI
jgi:hypothetical protein